MFEAQKFENILQRWVPLSIKKKYHPSHNAAQQEISAYLKKLEQLNKKAERNIFKPKAYGPVDIPRFRIVKIEGKKKTFYQGSATDKRLLKENPELKKWYSML